MVIISCYDSVEELERDLEEFQIRYDRAIAVPRGISKADVIRRENVAFYFDDQVSNLNDVSQATHCFLVRNKDNFNFQVGRWKIGYQHIDRDQR